MSILDKRTSSPITKEMYRRIFRAAVDMSVSIMKSGTQLSRRRKVLTRPFQSSGSRRLSEQLSRNSLSEKRGRQLDKTGRVFFFIFQGIANTSCMYTAYTAAAQLSQARRRHANVLRMTTQTNDPVLVIGLDFFSQCQAASTLL